MLNDLGLHRGICFESGVIALNHLSKELLLFIYLKERAKALFAFSLDAQRNCFLLIVEHC
jgi:Holliday junction resolvasome RuvABC DNA-binding subunit